jgi:hypothetical protein
MAVTTCRPGRLSSRRVAARRGRLASVPPEKRASFRRVERGPQAPA